MGVIIELVGLPGAGKSALAAALHAELERRGRAARLMTAGVSDGTAPVSRYLRKGRLVLMQLLTRPIPSLRFLWWLRSSRQIGVVGFLERLVAWLVTQRLLITARGGTADAIFDEGSLQALWSIGLYGEYEGLLDLWQGDRDLGVIGDLVLVVSPSLGMVEARLGGRVRPHSRIDHLGPDDRRRALERGSAIVEALAGALPALGLDPEAVVWVHNDSGAPPEERVASIADRVESMTR